MSNNDDTPKTPEAEPLAQLQAVLSTANSHPPIQRDVARPLAMALIEQMSATDQALANEMVTALWPEDESQADALMTALKKKIATIPDTKSKIHAAELLAKLGHMHQLAGLMLRERELVMATNPELGGVTTPTTTASFLKGKLGKNDAEPYQSAAKAVEALNTPRIELTFTAHPTNTNSQSGMQAQRDLGIALAAIVRGEKTDAETIEDALKAYNSAPLLPEKKPVPEKENELPGRTVWEETKNMLYHLNAVYDDLDGVYAGYDKELGQKADYDPTALKLNLGFNSWGSSADKDGNKNVNADTTLYALAMHHQHILMKYQNALGRIEDPSLDAMRVTINKACAALSDITKPIEEILDKNGGHLSESEHNHYQAALAVAVKGLEPKAWEAMLKTAYSNQTDDTCKKETLSLLRHMRIFGTNFGTLEYRETSEEFSRIMAALIPDYPLDDEENDSPEQIAAKEVARQKFLNEVLADPKKMAVLSTAFQQLANGQATQPYSNSDAGPIAYQTLKRLELARDFPEAIQNHVLAECQHTSNLLELLVLQHAVAKDGKRPMLGIIPLFEDRGPLEKSPQILRDVLQNPYYTKHLADVQTAQGHAKSAQQIQLAHSDNARRNGLPAARGLIYQAHQQLRTTMDELNRDGHEHPIDLQFYEGGSLTDSYRGGTRAISASVNEFGIHDFSKMTVQGGDLLNYFNLPHSTYRVMMRNITHNAGRLKNPTGTKKLQEEGIVKALAQCSDDYKVLFEGKDAPKFNAFLEAIGVPEEALAGNVSSRAGARDDSKKFEAAGVRTISFSEGCQHSGLNPSWIGSFKLREYLENQGIKTNDPAALNTLYDSDSPLFKDVIDRMLFGLVRTDMEYLRTRSDNHPLMADLDKEYDAAFKLAVEAYTGKSFEKIKTEETAKSDGLDLSTAKGQHQFLIREIYAHTQDVFADQDRFMELARSMKPAANDHSPLSEAEKITQARLATTLHNAGDTIIHGRLPLIDDPTYASIYCKNRDIHRPHVPQSSLARAA